MTLNVRLDSELEKRFNEAVRRQRSTKTEVATQLLINYVEACKPKSSYEIAEELGALSAPFEKSSPDLATNARKYLVAALKTKHRR